MAEYTVVQKNDAGGWIGYVALVDASDGKSFKANPTLASGDAKVSIDGGAFANLGTIPAVDPAAGIAVKITLSQAEINGDNIVITLIDQDATKEWADLAINLQPATNKLEDIATASAVSDLDSALVITDAAVDAVDSQLIVTNTAVLTIQADLDNATDGLGALKTLIDAVDSQLVVTDAVVDTIYSDTTVLEARTDLTSAVSDVKSALVVTDAVVDTIYSDTTLLVTNVAAVDSQLVVTDAVVDTIYSDTTVLEARTDLTSAASDVRSALVVTDAVVDTIYSDTTVLEARTDLTSAVSDVKSALVVTDAVVDTIYSDTTKIDTSTAAAESELIIVHSETTVIQAITDAIGATAAANLALSCGAAGIVTGTAQTGTLSTTVMTTDLSEVTDDHYIGRVIIWTSGVLLGQASDITDYSGTNGTLTYTLVTDAPSNGDTFIIV